MRTDQLYAWLLSRFPQPAYGQIFADVAIIKCRQLAGGK